jgi:UDP-2,4-diacetamido-2,4,6-trideoxy-beta-L-altropyranose hydrolase
MRIAFRADASIQQGTGHVMRCLSIARQLTKMGHECIFITQKFLPNFIQKISASGHELCLLPEYVSVGCTSTKNSEYHAWLQRPVINDAVETKAILSNLKCDIIVVDHYAIDEDWTQIVQDEVVKIVVIDDLANRRHICDLLIDQNYGRQKEHYVNLVPKDTELLIGTDYVFINEDFGEMRDLSIFNRLNRDPSLINVCLGGIDKDNATLLALKTLDATLRSDKWHVEAVIRGASPHVDEIMDYVSKMNIKTSVLIDCDDMAEVFSRADLAIGAGGVTLWERCCLGLPTILITIADNQLPAAIALESTGSIKLCGDIRHDDLSDSLAKAIKSVLRDPTQIHTMSKLANSICDGKGIYRVCNRIHNL